MRTDSRVTVGSPTVRVMVIMAATLLLILATAAAGIGAKRLLASDSIIVDHSGGGDYTTISEAVATVADGGSVLIRPGRYVESVAVVGKDLTIARDGEGEVIIEAAATGSPDGFDLEPHFGDDAADVTWAVLLAETTTSLADLTIASPDDAEGILILGADAEVDLARLVVRSSDVLGDINAVTWLDGARGTLHNSTVEGWVNFGTESKVIVEGNDMPASCVVALAVGADVVLRRNTVHGCPYENGLMLSTESSILVEGNDIWVEAEDPDVIPYSGGRVAIDVEGSGPGPVTIRGNDIRDSLLGISLRASGGEVQVMGNRVSGNETGVEIGFGSKPTVVDNEICDNGDDLVAPLGIDEEELAAANDAC